MGEANTNLPILAIGNKTCPIDSHSEIAKTQLTYLQNVDPEIQRLQHLLDIAQVARETFLAKLQAESAKFG